MSPLGGRSTEAVIIIIIIIRVSWDWLSIDQFKALHTRGYVYKLF